MKIEARRQLTVLDAIHRDQRVTQRHLAAKLGIALGLTNIYLKRLIRKGYVKCVNLQANRLLYLLTPLGITEKSRLTFEFMRYSLQMYRGVRRQLAGILLSCSERGAVRIAVFGTGEAAEIIYLSLRERGLEPVAIFASEGGGTFLGMPVRGVDECSLVSFDCLLIATLEKPGPVVKELVRAGVSREKLLTLKATLKDRQELGELS
jgi:DNA-binding MarR family transcriptional regulator